MQELMARLGAIFSQLGEQVQAALQNPDTGAAIAAAIDVILPVACGIFAGGGHPHCHFDHRPLPHVPVPGEDGQRDLGLAHPWPTGPSWTCAIGILPSAGGAWVDVGLIFPPSPQPTPRPAPGR